MNLWDYLQNSAALVVANRFVLDVPLLRAWADDNANELGAGKATFDRYADEINRHEQGKVVRVDLCDAGQRAHTTQRERNFFRQLTAEQLTYTIDGGPLDTFDRRVGLFRRRVFSLISMGLNGKTPFPALRRYPLAATHVTGLGFTMAFQSHHLSTNDKDEKLAKSIAEHRFRDNANLNRSTVILSQCSAEFEREVAARKVEFAETYAALTDWYIKSSLAATYADALARGASARQLVDGITFVSKGQYDVWEYDRVGAAAKGGLVRGYVRFGIAPTEAGTDWAVHHLAGMGREAAPGSQGLRDVGISTGTEYTTFVNPFVRA